MPGTSDAVMADLPFFRLGRRFGRDSALLYYRGVCLQPNGPPVESNGSSWDSVTVSDRPLYFSDKQLIQAPILKIALLQRWPEPPHRADSTCTVYGRLRDERNGRASNGRVYVLHTAMLADADSLGYFELKGVPVGAVELHAIRVGTGSAVADTSVEVPCDTLTVRLLTPTTRHWPERRKQNSMLAALPGTRSASKARDALPKLGEYVYVEELPEAIKQVPPNFPDSARDEGLEGVVVVQALVGKQGRVLATHVQRSIHGLDDYAVEAVRQWRFKPARTGGEPIAVWVAIPVKFVPR